MLTPGRGRGVPARLRRRVGGSGVLLAVRESAVQVVGKRRDPAASVGLLLMPDIDQTVETVVAVPERYSRLYVLSEAGSERRGPGLAIMGVGEGVAQVAGRWARDVLG